MVQYGVGLITIIAITNCAPTSKFVYNTKHGFNIHCEDVNLCYSQEQVEIITDVVMGEMSQMDYKAYNRKKLENFLEHDKFSHDIVFVKNKFSCPGHDFCYGLHDVKIIKGFSYSTLKVKWEKCIAVSVLGHELIHFFHRHIKKKIDEKHEKKGYWTLECKEIKDSKQKKECFKNSLIRKVNWKSCQLLCKELCNG